MLVMCFAVERLAVAVLATLLGTKDGQLVVERGEKEKVLLINISAIKQPFFGDKEEDVSSSRQLGVIEVRPERDA